MYDNEFQEDLMRIATRTILTKAVTSEYAHDIVYKKTATGKTILDEIVENIKETSGFEEDITNWNDDDVRLAIGRILINNLCVEDK